MYFFFVNMFPFIPQSNMLIVLTSLQILYMETEDENILILEWNEYTWHRDSFLETRTTLSCRKYRIFVKT